jgi:hypothetical protein
LKNTALKATRSWLISILPVVDKHVQMAKKRNVKRQLVLRAFINGKYLATEFVVKKVSQLLRIQSALTNKTNAPPELRLALKQLNQKIHFALMI